MLKKILLLGISALSAYAMHTAEININNKDLELDAQIDIGQFNDAVEPDTMFVGVKFFNADAEHSDNEYADIDPYYEVSFLMMRPVGNQGLKIGLGVKLNYTEITLPEFNSNKDFMTIPLGLEADYKLPFKGYFPMHLSGELYYAPSVLSFSNADSFFEYRMSCELEVIDNGRVIFGYRSLDTNYENMDFSYNSSWYVGFKVKF